MISSVFTAGIKEILYPRPLSNPIMKFWLLWSIFVYKFSVLATKTPDVGQRWPKMVGMQSLVAELALKYICRKTPLGIWQFIWSNGLGVKYRIDASGFRLQTNFVIFAQLFTDFIGEGKLQEEALTLQRCFCSTIEWDLREIFWITDFWPLK